MAGEAVQADAPMRNIGGRVTPAVIRSWALLAKLGQAHPSGQPGGSPPHMVVLHHTDCGIKTLADHPEPLAEYFEIPVEELDSKAVRDPHAAVRIDVDIVRRTLPAALVVSGLVYDIDTGLVEVVVPPATTQDQPHLSLA
jgi:carbonic anhydrase